MKAKEGILLEASPPDTGLVNAVAPLAYAEKGINFLRREFSVNQDIGEPTIDVFNTAVRLFSDSEDWVTCFFSTEGGNVENGLAIYSLLKYAPFKLRMIVTGYCYSMGGIILQAADERLMVPNAHLMLHWGTQGVEDSNPDNYRRKLKFQERLDDICNRILHERMVLTSPKLRVGTVARKTKLDWYLNPSEAIKHNLIDGVWTGDKK